MKVCVVGGGAREHALAHVLSRTAEVVVTPGNPLIPGSTDQPPEEIDADLFVVGPEAPLVDGLADRLRARGALVFGPGADGARLEGSKAWMKHIAAVADLPTARHGAFTDQGSADAFLDTMGDLFVVKTDGLAAGKGVIVTESRAEASAAVAEYLSGAAFGDAGRTVVIEEGMVGPELSLLAVCDGQGAVALAPAQDFKRVADGDAGPNTGGMGAYSPVPFVDDALVDQVMDRFVDPTLHTLRERGIDYRGVLYAGLMLTAEGPKLVEYNVRFGDPEAEVVLPRFSGDLAQLLAEAAAGHIETEPTFTDEAAVTVVMASEGYPQSPRTGDVISGLDEAATIPGVVVFGAGVATDDSGQVVTAGGRVLAVTAVAPGVSEARTRAYRAVDAIDWPGCFSRRDIAASAVAAHDAGVASGGR
ncbi:MAG: phosphoribosylamine--glycine ligase [Acidimicrobiia bacterium]|nr:phosphoribosylamine--glycine ligase [Acidimicrobiia bacterium]